MAIFQTDWSAASSYAVGALANYDGVIYRATEIIPGGVDNQNPCIDTARWAVDYVERVEGLTSILEQARIEINNDDPVINSSMISYVQRASNYMNQRIRPTTNLTSVIFTTRNISNEGYEGRVYVPVPTDILQVESIRLNDSVGYGYGLLASGRIEMTAAQSDADFEIVRQIYLNNDSTYGERTLTNFTAPVYRFVTIGGNSYFEFAPSQIATGAEVEIRYWAAEPQLGTPHPRINSQGDPLNSAGQTIAQWRAANLGMNTPAITTIEIPTVTSIAGDNFFIRVTVTVDNGFVDILEVTAGISPGTDHATIVNTLAGVLRDTVDNNSCSVTVDARGRIEITTNAHGAGNSIVVNDASGTLAGRFVRATVETTEAGPPFIQEIVRIENNWFTLNAPYCVLYATLMMAHQWLKDDQRAASYKALYAEEEARVIDMIYRFEEVRPTEQQMYNPYSI